MPVITRRRFVTTTLATGATPLFPRVVRAQTVGTHPAFIAMLKELIDESIQSATPPVCSEGCCPPAVAGRPR